MRSVNDVARSVLAAIDSSASVGPINVLKWINERYVELVARVKFKHRRQKFSLFYPSPLTAGTISPTNSSTQVTGTGTSFSPSILGWQIRAEFTWYTVVGVEGQTLTLDSAYSDPGGSGLGYTLLQRYLPLDPSIRWIGTISHQRTGRALRRKSLSYLDKKYPDRLLVGPWPVFWAEGPSYQSLNPTLPDRRKQIEIYPPSNQTETYIIEGWTLPDDLSLEDLLPPEIDPYILREGVLIDLYRHASEQAAKANNMDMAAYYANKEARQRTVWEQRIQDAARADAGSEDIDLITWSEDEEEAEFRDIVTAEDQVWSTESR